jgi:hypothetical protein
MKALIPRSVLVPVLVSFALAGCRCGPGDIGARADTKRPELIPPPLPAPSLNDGLPPAADGDPPPVAETDSSPQGECDPNYTPCVPIDSDVDCAGGKGDGPSYVRGPVRVVGVDRYGLDQDGDGVGCEN